MLENNNFFFKCRDAISIKELKTICNFNIDGNIDENITIQDVCDIDNSRINCVSFLSKHVVSGDKYINKAKDLQCSFCFVGEKEKNLLPDGIVPLVCKNPYFEFLQLCCFFYKKKIQNNEKNEISNSAIIDNSSSIGNGVFIGDNVVIDKNVTIENGVKIGNNTVIKNNISIGYNCSIGENCIIESGVSIEYTEIKNRCHMYQNSVIGKSGFGYTINTSTGENVKINHFGGVKIGNNVEIGSCSCVDRGVFHDTRLESGVKLDNIIQIGHGVCIGTNTVIAAHSCVAGSTSIGQNCMIGGKVAISGHIKIGDNTMILGGSTVTKTFPDGSVISGYPAENANKWRRKIGMINIMFMRQKSNVVE